MRFFYTYILLFALMILLIQFLPFVLLVLYIVSLIYGAWQQRKKTVQSEKRNPDAIDAEYTEHDEEDQ